LKVLFLVPYPHEGGSNRIRVEQYFPYLKIAGVRYGLRPFISKNFYRILYQERHYILKFTYFIFSTINRFIDIFRAYNYDIIFIHREAYPLGPCFIEYILSKVFKKKLIYDFDDAIFLPNVSDSNKFIKLFKWHKKIISIIKLSNFIIAGNSYLKDFALKFNKQVTIIPSSVDTQTYFPQPEKAKKEKVVIGWIGSNTTVEYLNLIRGVFGKLLQRYANLEFCIVGGDFKTDKIKNITSKKWSLEDEKEILSNFDVGIAPMSNNEWAKGKCGFKAILYMSMAIPCVCSPVGVNREIIKDGINGFLADREEEWIEKLSALIENPQLRKKFGFSGKQTVEEKYSIRVNAPKFLGVIKEVYCGS